MKTSLIITTYNWKEALELCLKTTFTQSVLPDEIIVADDGSREDTAEMVHACRAYSPVPLIHSWQPDEGFRVAASRNRGIARSSGDYIIMIDGDLLLHRHFCADHIRNATPDRWLRGTRAFLTPEKTADVLRTGQTRIGFFERGLRFRRRTIHSNWLGKLWSRSKKERMVQGCNISCRREHAIAVNGYDEAFTGWGHEDSEFAARLANLGVRQKALHYQGIVYHLYHNERSLDRSASNRELWNETVRSGRVRCDKGIDQYLS